MAISKDLGLSKTAQALGLKRRFFGFESDKSLARRVVAELGKINPIVSFFEGLEKAFAPRVCLREEHIVHHAGGKIQNEWVYHYSDGANESVIGGWV